MNRREKILFSAVSGLVGLFIVGFGIRAALIKPLKDLDKRITASREKFDKINAEKRQFFSTEDHLKNLALQTFGDNVDQASAASGEILTRQILQSGLEETEFTRVPAPPRKLKGASEIGWMVQGEGPLTNVVNLLFVLENSPYLHRVEGLSIGPGDHPGRAKVRFRFLTLIFEPAPEVTRKALPEKVALDSVERRTYDDLIARDLLRPYIKAPPKPAVQIANKSNQNSAGGVTAPGPESFKVVSLSEWNGQPEVHVLDTTAQKTTRYVPGQKLAGGEIVCVDYRELALPGSFALSESRVILKVGSEFWAIERGKTLADKHKLDPDQLPQNLANAVK
jgi:hypothetical protein